MASQQKTKLIVHVYLRIDHESGDPKANYNWEFRTFLREAMHFDYLLFHGLKVTVVHLSCMDWN